MKVDILKKDGTDPVRTFMISYPRLAIIKAAFSLLKCGKDINYTNMKQTLENMMFTNEKE